MFRLGTYDTPQEAAKVYDEHARVFFGEFAFQNFPRDIDTATQSD